MHIVAIGGSDAGISAALRARELDPACEVTVVVADAYPNFSICGIPYYVGEGGRLGGVASEDPDRDRSAVGVGVGQQPVLDLRQAFLAVAGVAAGRERVPPGHPGGSVRLLVQVEEQVTLIDPRTVGTQ